jgi:hypothetical protein
VGGDQAEHNEFGKKGAGVSVGAALFTALLRNPPDSRRTFGRTKSVFEHHGGPKATG